MTAILVCLTVLSAGSATAWFALHRWGWRGAPLAVGAIALAPALGYGSLSLATFAWAWSGRVGGRPLLVSTALTMAAALVGLTPRRPPLPPRRRESLPRGVALSSVVAGVLALSAVAAATPALLRARPLGQYDAHAIWNARAAFLFRAEESPSTLFRTMLLGHPGYPLFVPGAVAGQWSLLGREATLIPQATSAAFLLATAVAIGAALAARHRPLAGCLAVALYLSTPNALRWGMGQCADVPSSYLLAMAAVGCAGFLAGEEEAPLPPSLTGFLLGLLAWTKNEGMLLAALVTGLLVVLGLVRRGKGVGTRTWAQIGLAAAAPLLALVLFKLHWSPKNEIGVFLDGGSVRVTELARWGTVAAAFLNEFDPLTAWRRWGAVWPFAFVGCIWSARALVTSRDPVRAALLLALVGALATCFFIYVVGPRDLPWQLRTSLDRLLLQLLPLALLCALDWPLSEGQRVQAA